MFTKISLIPKLYVDGTTHLSFWIYQFTILKLHVGEGLVFWLHLSFYFLVIRASGADDSEEPLPPSRPMSPMEQQNIILSIEREELDLTGEPSDRDQEVRQFKQTLIDW